MTTHSALPRRKLGKPVLAALALISAAYGAGVFTVTAIRERSYFSRHSAMKARALSIPAKLTATENEIRSEQRQILALEAAIQAASR